MSSLRDRVSKLQDQIDIEELQRDTIALQADKISANISKLEDQQDDLCQILYWTENCRRKAEHKMYHVIEEMCPCSERQSQAISAKLTYATRIASVRAASLDPNNKAPAKAKDHADTMVNLIALGATVVSIFFLVFAVLSIGREML